MSSSVSAMIKARAEATSLIVLSPHRLRVVVAGPGTGKSTLFRDALDKVEGKGLALTFLRTLAADLADHLEERALTLTFHAYSKMLVHHLGPPGLTQEFSLYPPLMELLAVDLGVMGLREPTQAQVERALQDLDEESRLTVGAMGLGSYYDAASFIDLVYRVFRFLQDNPERTPTYPLVVVDEYQDFTRLETAFIQQLGFTSKLLIAGDDDQALYKFRFASPEFIRALANLSSAERHELPYCSRCTAVVVDAINTTIQKATEAGLMKGRLTKKFVCYLPDKSEASARYPRIVHAKCSINRYIRGYVEEQIDRISLEDIQSSIEGKHPTALVIGPRQFVQPVYKLLVEGRYPQATYRSAEEFAVEPIHGYRRIADDPRSNLGWRIIVHLFPWDGWEEAIEAALAFDDPLVSRLPDPYRLEHLAVARLFARGRAGENLTNRETRTLAHALSLSRVEVAALFRENEPREDTTDEGVPQGEGAAVADSRPVPTVLCTSLVGAKGLSAEHVFVVGCVNTFLPVDRRSPTEQEVCEFLVALSRTRKACHLISTKIYLGDSVLSPSVFVDWIADHVETRDVDAAYWRLATRSGPVT